MNTTETQWLDDVEQDMWRAWLYSGFSAISVIDEDLKTTGMDLFEYHTLVQASENPDGISVGQIANAVIASPQRMTQRIKAMEKRGLISVTEDPEDRRVRLVTITEEGLSRLVSAAPTHVTSVRKTVFAGLDQDEVAVLAKLSKKIFLSSRAAAESD
jgi:DNA-binding MarR family transcriptional regulator